MGAELGAGRPTVVSRRGVTYGYGYRLRWPRPLYHNRKAPSFNGKARFEPENVGTVELTFFSADDGGAKAAVAAWLTMALACKEE